MSEEPNIARLLGANPFLGRLEPEVLKMLADLFVTRKLSAQEMLFQRGDPGHALFAIPAAPRPAEANGVRHLMIPVTLSGGAEAVI